MVKDYGYFPYSYLEHYVPKVVINNTDGQRLKKAKSATDKALREENKKKFYDGFASPRKRY